MSIDRLIISLTILSCEYAFVFEKRVINFGGPFISFMFAQAIMLGSVKTVSRSSLTFINLKAASFLNTRCSSAALVRSSSSRFTISTDS